MKSALSKDILHPMVAITIAIAALGLSSCGDDSDPSASASHATSTTAGTTDSTSSETAISSSGSSQSESSTGAVEPCSRVHEGDLYVWDDSDLEALSDLGRVTGVLHISLKDREQPDLSYLSCLHTVDHALYIDYNERLESTGGMKRLSSLGSLAVVDNANLKTIEGFNQITELAYLEIDHNPMLETVNLGALESVDTLLVGHCEGTHSAANQLALADLDGFGSLAKVKWLTVEGNKGLLSVGLLDSLIENGAAQPLLSATIRRNPWLLDSEIQHKLELLGVAGTVCGNAEDDPECFCFVG